MPDNSPGSQQFLDIPMDSGIARAKRSRLLGLLGLSAAFGVIEHLNEESGLAGMLIIAGTIGTILLIVSWCLLDGRERNYEIPKPLLMTIVLIGLIGVPFYLIRTRGVRGLWSCLLAFLFLGLMVVIQQIASMAISILKS